MGWYFGFERDYLGGFGFFWVFGFFEGGLGAFYGEKGGFGEIGLGLLSFLILPPASAPELREGSGPPSAGTELLMENLLFLKGQENFLKGSSQ